MATATPGMYDAGRGAANVVSKFVQETFEQGESYFASSAVLIRVIAAHVHGRTSAILVSRMAVRVVACFWLKRYSCSRR